jgi:hypothetical protein
LLRETARPAAPVRQDAQQPKPVEALPSKTVDRAVVNFGQDRSLTAFPG